MTAPQPIQSSAGRLGSLIPRLHFVAHTTVRGERPPAGRDAGVLLYLRNPILATRLG
jgi:hypothetical protein